MRVLQTIPSESGGSGKRDLIRNATGNKCKHHRVYFHKPLCAVYTRLHGIPLWYMQSVIDQNAIMRHMMVLSFSTGHEISFPSERYGVARGPDIGDTATSARPRKCSLSLWPGVSFLSPEGTR